MAKSKIEIVLSAKDSGLTTALKRGQVSLRAFSSQVKGAAAPFGSLISSALSLKTALAGIVTGVGITTLSRSLLSAGQEMDRLRLAYTAISGSGQNAAKEMAFVSETANKLGLDLQTATQAYKGIAAASQGTSLAGKQTQAIFTAVAKASTVLGLSADETSGALLAISQMISKGKVSAEELRGQLGERLPGAFQIAAKAMGVTTAELDQMLSDGEIFSEVFIPKFAAALENRFAGAATKAAGQFGAASNRISSELFKIQGALGQAVTNNTFFVEAMGKVSTMLGGVSADAGKNAAAWRQWAKESSLAVLQFVADTADGLNDVYKSLSFLGGSLKLAYAGALTLGRGFQYLFEQSNRVFGDDQKAEYWAKAQAEATLLIEKAMSGAVKSFDNAEQGSKTLETATKRITELKKELESIKADEVNPVEDLAKKAEIEFKQIGGRWVAVEKQIQQSNKETAKEVGINWGEVYKDFERNGLDAAAAVDKALDKMARDREVTLRIKEVQTRQAGGAIYKLAKGGSPLNLSRGRKLPGFGGGDKIDASLEAGEMVINKFATKAIGMRASYAWNNQQWDVVLAELLKKTRSNFADRIGYALGGLSGMLPGPIHLAGGGMMPAAASPAPGYSASFSFTDQSGQPGRVHGSEIDIRRLEAAIKKHNRFRSSNR